LIQEYPLHPEAFEARLLNARADWVRGDFETGFESLTEALRYAPDDDARQKVRLFTGELYQESEQFEKAVEEFDLAYLASPVGRLASEALLKHADCLYNLEKYNESAEKYRSIIRDFPESEYAGNAQYSIGLIYFQQNRLDEYLAECLRVVDKHPETRQSALALEGATALMVERKRLAEAVELQRKMVSQYGRFIDSQLVRFRLAQNLISLGKFEAARDELTVLLEMAATGRYAADATISLADLSVADGDINVAIELLEGVIKQFPYHPRRVEAIEKASRYLTQLEQWQRAISLWMLVADDGRESDLIRAQSALGELYYREGKDLEKAAEYAEVVTRINDRERVASAKLLSAKIQQKQGDIENSLNGYLKISYLYPDQKDVVIDSLVYAAALLKTQGKHDQMNRVLEKATEKADTAQRRERILQLKRETGLSGGTE